MASLEDLFKGGAGSGLLIGIGALVLGPTLIPAIGRALRPLAKTMVKTGISLYEESVATVSEATGDIVAEARSELASEGKGRQKSSEHHAPAKG